MAINLLSFCIVIIGILLQISIVRDVDVVLSILFSMVFFRPIGHVFVLTVISGFLLDMYSPLFGLRSILSSIVLIGIYHLSITLFTNRSFPSFLFLGVCASLAFSGLYSMTSAGLAFFTGHEYLSPLFSLEAMRQGGVALFFQGLVLSLLYPLFSKTALKNSTV
ncbi:MAG: hypothetical protein Q7R79_01305 [bacterium]|nr:hypothetical protein [bacterium]